LGRLHTVYQAASVSVCCLCVYLLFMKLIDDALISPGGALTFFTYCELTFWIVSFHAFRFERLKWLPFILFGWGTRPIEVADSGKQL
jgi:hypothetical protein